MLLINSLIEISGNIIASLRRICVTVQYFSVVNLGTNLRLHVRNYVNHIHTSFYDCMIMLTFMGIINQSTEST